MRTFRLLLVAFGLLEMLVPERIVQWGERLAFENPGEGTLRPWTLPMARLEGLAFVWLVLRGRSVPTPFRGALAAIGLPAALFPKPFVTGALGMAYENPADLELQSWVVPFTRVLGVVYLVVALFAGRADAPMDDGQDEALELDPTDS
ncbi:hypothetical protein [Natronoglomus mannanivorans]|uniref:Uncharacterized protein n=1 Tax=Natronoglomus mannanivorans TaxID=2979990 RepID=A0AAP2Z1E0_9EURY|nr:hypothetical protein [Halobacteria archaeon AArc-xg1-1]